MALVAGTTGAALSSPRARLTCSNYFTNPADYWLLSGNASTDQNVPCALHCGRGMLRQMCGGPLYRLRSGPALSLAQCQHLFGNETCDKECGNTHLVDCREVRTRRRVWTECTQWGAGELRQKETKRMRSCGYIQRRLNGSTAKYSFYHGQTVLFQRIKRNEVVGKSTECDCVDGEWKKHASRTANGELKRCKWMKKSGKQLRTPISVITLQC